MKEQHQFDYIIDMFLQIIQEDKDENVQGQCLSKLIKK